METTGGDASWLNGKNKRQKISIHNMVISGIIDTNQHEKNGPVPQKHHQKSIDARYIVN